MSFLDQFGLGGQEIVDKGRCTEGTITDVKTLWLLKVNTKVIRKSPTDGAAFPHRITFRYTVDGKEYMGSRVLAPSVTAPARGDQITVYYDPDAPEHCTLQIGAI